MQLWSWFNYVTGVDTDAKGCLPACASGQLDCALSYLATLLVQLVTHVVNIASSTLPYFLVQLVTHVVIIASNTLPYSSSSEWP